MLMRILLLAMAFSLCACDHVRKRTDIAAHKYYNGNYQSAFRNALIAAQYGDADAQYAVGYMYYYGRGVIADDREARRWFTAAAKQGHPDAQRALKLTR